MMKTEASVVDLSPVLTNLSGSLALTLAELRRLMPRFGPSLEEGIDVLARRRLIEARRTADGEDYICSITAEGLAVSASGNRKRLTPRKRVSTITNMVETTIDIKVALKAVESCLAISLTDLATRLSVSPLDLRPVMTTLAERALIRAKELPGDDEVIYHITAAGVRELAEQEQRNWRSRL